MAAESDKIRELYHEKRKSMSELAVMYDTNIGVVQYFFKVFGIQARDKFDRPLFKKISIRKVWENHRDEIKRLYVDENMSSIDLGKIYGIPADAIGKILKHNGVKMRQKTHEKYLRHIWADVDNIIRLYTEEQLSRVQISNQYGCSHKTIENILKKNNVPIRKYSSPLKTKTCRDDADIVVNLYTKHEMSLSTIASKYGVSAGTIRRVLRNNGIILNKS